MDFGIAYGLEDYVLGTLTGTLDFTELMSVRASAFYTSTSNMMLGREYFKGERITSTGATFDADRVDASVTFSF